MMNILAVMLLRASLERRLENERVQWMLQQHKSPSRATRMVARVAICARVGRR